MLAERKMSDELSDIVQVREVFCWLAKEHSVDSSKNIELFDILMSSFDKSCQDMRSMNTFLSSMSNCFASNWHTFC